MDVWTYSRLAVVVFIIDYKNQKSYRGKKERLLKKLQFSFLIFFSKTNIDMKACVPLKNLDDVLQQVLHFT